MPLIPGMSWVYKKRSLPSQAIKHTKKVFRSASIMLCHRLFLLPIRSELLEIGPQVRDFLLVLVGENHLCSGDLG